MIVPNHPGLYTNPSPTPKVDSHTEPTSPLDTSPIEGPMILEDQSMLQQHSNPFLSPHESHSGAASNMQNLNMIYTNPQYMRMMPMSRAQIHQTVTARYIDDASTGPQLGTWIECDPMSESDGASASQMSEMYVNEDEILQMW